VNGHDEHQHYFDKSRAVRGTVQPYHAGGSSPIYRELRPATYHRVFVIGKNVDAASVDAVYDQGVLTLKLLKREEVRPRQIDVKVR
jgi:HSP20 family protein